MDTCHYCDSEIRLLPVDDTARVGPDRQGVCDTCGHVVTYATELVAASPTQRAA